jgi:hypothetical protein
VPSAEHLDAQILRRPSLPVARQWLAWLRYHEDHLPGYTGWQRLLRDTLIDLHHQIACSARRLRNNPTWDIQGTMTDDTESLEEKATRNLARFNALNRRDVPTRFEQVLDCLFGALRQQVRLGREIDTMRRAGALRVDVQVDTVATTAVEQ